MWKDFQCIDVIGLASGVDPLRGNSSKP